MTRLTRVVTLPAGRRAKWALLIIWIALTVVVVPLASKLAGQEKDEVTSYLPGNAESTQVLDRQRHYGRSDTAPAVVVYHRSGGLTSADLTAAKADRQEIGRRGLVASSGGDDRVSGPVLNKSRDTAQIIFSVASADSTSCPTMSSWSGTSRTATTGFPPT
ncbi:MAG: hypothetical protein ACR2F6_09590 [Mycobacteriales bacterium]